MPSPLLTDDQQRFMDERLGAWTAESEVRGTVWVYQCTDGDRLLRFLLDDRGEVVDSASFRATDGDRARRAQVAAERGEIDSLNALFDAEG